MGGSGGKAVSGGIGFQQRVGGFFLAIAGLQLRLDDLFSIQGLGEIGSIRFETSDDVDDLCLITHEGRRCYCQIKRTLSLSLSPTSEFGSAISQCVRQFASKESVETDLYALIISPSASRQVTNSLQRILNAIKQSPDQFASVPFNQDEQKALTVMGDLFGQQYRKYCGKTHDSTVFANFCKRLLVISLDIDRHGVQENAILALLLSRLQVGCRDAGRAWSIWHKCVFSAAEFFSTRAVLEVGAVRELLGSQLNDPPSGDRIHWDSQNLQAGMEVLLVESFIENADYIATDIVRFEGDGARRLRFTEGKVEIAPGGPTVSVVYRSATWYGLERYLLEQSDVFAEKSLAVIQARLDLDPNRSQPAIDHGDIVERMLKERSEITQCLHCGRVINQLNALIVEVDEEGMSNVAGIIHNYCRRPTDRVYGRVEIRGNEIPELLSDFDLSAWAKAVVKGQRGLQDALQVARDGHKLPRMLWTPESLSSSFGTWCLSSTLADGSTHYIRSRSRVERMGREEAFRKAEVMNRYIQEAASNSNPFCYTTSGTFGPRSSLEAGCPTEEITECKEFNVLKYSSAFESNSGDWYAPICFVTERSSDRICILGEEAVPLFSNPLQIAEMLDNWRSMGLEIGEVRVHSILTDAEFDLQCKQWLDEGLYLVVDARLSSDGILKQGVVITEHNSRQRPGSER